MVRRKKKRPKCLPETYSHCTGCDLWLLIWSHLSLVSGLATWSPLALHTQQVPSTTGPLHMWFSLSGMPSCHFSLPPAGGLSQAPQLQESDHVPPLLHSPMAHTSRNKDGCTHLYNGICFLPQLLIRGLGGWAPAHATFSTALMPGRLQVPTKHTWRVEQIPRANLSSWGTPAPQLVTFSYHHPLPTP